MKYRKEWNSPNKKCIGCKVDKPRSLEFYFARNVAPDGLTPRCKECLKEPKAIRHKEYRQNKNEHVCSLNKNSRLKRTYGLTLEEYRDRLKQQSYLCEICGLPESRTFKGKPQDLSIDHCHITGKIRGLICNNCNVGLGRFKDSLETLRKAVKYCEKFEETK
jgi:hypothetical protein